MRWRNGAGTDREPTLAFPLLRLLPGFPAGTLAACGAQDFDGIKVFGDEPVPPSWTIGNRARICSRSHSADRNSGSLGSRADFVYQQSSVTVGATFLFCVADITHLHPLMWILSSWCVHTVSAWGGLSLHLPSSRPQSCPQP